MTSEATGNRELCSYGALGYSIAHAGLFHFGGNTGLTHPNWTIATYVFILEIILLQITRFLHMDLLCLVKTHLPWV